MTEEHSGALLAVIEGAPPSIVPALYLTRLSPGSRRAQRSALDTAARLMSGGRVLADGFPWQALRHAHVAALRVVLEGRHAPRTANRILSAVKGAVRAAFLAGLMSAEDCERALAVPWIRFEALPGGRRLTAGELRALFEATRRPRDAALLGVLYGCGLRVGEACGLRVEDVETARRVLRVRGKGAREREVNMPAGTAAAVEAARQGRELGPLFPSPGDASRPVSTRAAAGLLSRLGARAGIGAVRPHDLRRTYVSDLLDLGADLLTVQRLTGHASSDTVRLYDLRDAGTRAAAADLLHVPFRE